VVYYHDGRDDIEVVLKGCIRAEKIDDPTYYIHAILAKADSIHIKKIYGVENWESDENFLE
jgi:nuclear GTP-binding protein